MSDDVTAPTLLLEGAIKIKAKKLHPKKHALFDTFGGCHAIDNVFVGKKWVRSERADGFVDYFEINDTLTVYDKEH